MIDVFCDSVAEYKIGQQVIVSTSGQVAAKALLWAFGVPFVLLMVVLVLVLLLTGNEGWAALGALVALVPYYIILWLLRDKMREQLAFRIE
jgi:sigma-E factor negative regulatory protein RseC